MYTVISAIISAAAAIFVCLLSQNDIARKQAMQFDKQMALIDLRLTELTKNVEKHNDVIRRTYELEKQCEIFEEKFKVANHRIDDLEDETKLLESNGAK